jgi:hypothetical protein
MNILKLVAQLGLDGKPFKAGMKDAASSAKSIGSEIGGSFKAAIAGAFGAAALGAYIRGTVAAANTIKDLAEQFNATTDEVQRFGKAAKDAGGLTFNDIGGTILRLSQAREAAITGNDKMLATFNKYGVTLKQLQDPTLRNIELMQMLGHAMKDLSETDRADLADLFGKTGQKLLATLLAVNELGPIELIRKEEIDALDEAVERLDEVKRRLDVKAAAPLANVGTAFANFIEDPARFIGMEKRGLSDDEVKIREEYKKRGDEIGTGLVKDLGSSLRWGGQKEQADARDILMRYVKGQSLGGRGLLSLGSGKTQSNDPSASWIIEREQKATPAPTPKDPLNEITPQTQARLEQERKRSEERVAEAAFKFRLSQAKGEHEQRKLLEDQLAKHVEAARKKRELADVLTPEAAEKKRQEADAEDIAAMELRTRIAALKGSGSKALSVDAWTAGGQLGGGRDIISSRDDRTAQAIKVQTDQLKLAVKAIGDINAKVQSVKGTVVSV